MAAVARRVVEGTKQSVVTEGRLGDAAVVDPKNPVYIQHRVELFERLYDAQEAKRKALPNDPIEIILPDGSVKPGIRNETTPLSIAQGISKGLADNCVVARITYTDTEDINKAAAGPVVCDDVAEEEEEEDEGCCGTASQLWDLTRPLEGSCKLELLKFDSKEGAHTFWHSSSHVLGECLEAEFGAHLTIGPALERGFYYDFYAGPNTTFSQELYANIDKHAARIAKENQPFQRLTMSKDEALEMFKHNPFKVALISSKIPEGALTTCYRCGPLIDLCRGPHLPTTARVKAFAVEKHSSVYWLGNAANDSLQRVYAVSFPDNKLMKQHKLMIEEAKKRDHRVVGNAMDLFFFETNLSPGCCFWLADGAKVYNKLCDFIRAEYRHRGFSEVLSPNIFSCDLFKVSGHYQNYKENMYCFDVEGKEWALKPMNCPGHCLMFKHMAPSYRQLPIRMADFGVLHRNEASGSLTGLTRVRRFQQDDAHIFCTMEQVKEEVQGALNFLFFVYGVFGFTFDLQLSTRPKKALGSRELWDEAELALTEALDAIKLPWSVNPGDGAFYGPKIDIKLKDALQRWHQCGTIQLDFQLPLRFNLSYQSHKMPTSEKSADNSVSTMPSDVAAPVKCVTTDDHRNGLAEAGVVPQQTKDGQQAVIGSWEAPLKPGHERPVMIHRAILGSIERMSAVLVEHTAGKFPFWLSPRQIIVLPISERFHDYAKHVAQIFSDRGFHVHVDESNTTINKKIREAQMAKWNYAFVVGQQEEESNKVMVRSRDDPDKQSMMAVKDILEMLQKEAMPTSKPPVPVIDFQPSATKKSDDSQSS